MEGRTDRHDKANTRFSQVCEHASTRVYLNIFEVTSLISANSSIVRDNKEVLNYLYLNFKLLLDEKMKNESHYRFRKREISAKFSGTED